MTAIEDQPAPQHSTAPPTWELVIQMLTRYKHDPDDDLVIADMRDRDRIGRERYGTPLQHDNGRDHLVDAYQEQLDAIVYTASEMLKHGIALDSIETPLADTLWLMVSMAVRLRKFIANRRLATITEEDLGRVVIRDPELPIVAALRGMLRISPDTHMTVALERVLAFAERLSKPVT